MKFTHLFLREMKPGEKRPIFFLPVEYTPMYQKIVCWFILLAPIVLLLLATRNAIECFYYDIVRAVKLWREYK